MEKQEWMEMMGLRTLEVKGTGSVNDMLTSCETQESEMFHTAEEECEGVVTETEVQPKETSAANTMNHCRELREEQVEKTAGEGKDIDEAEGTAVGKRGKNVSRRKSHKVQVQSVEIQAKPLMISKQVQIDSFKTFISRGVQCAMCQCGSNQTTGTQYAHPDSPILRNVISEPMSTVCAPQQNAKESPMNKKDASSPAEEICTHRTGAKGKPSPRNQDKASHQKNPRAKRQRSCESACKVQQNNIVCATQTSPAKKAACHGVDVSKPVVPDSSLPKETTSSAPTVEKVTQKINIEDAYPKSPCQDPESHGNGHDSDTPLETRLRNLPSPCFFSYFNSMACERNSSPDSLSDTNEEQNLKDPVLPNYIEHQRSSTCGKGTAAYITKTQPTAHAGQKSTPYQSENVTETRHHPVSNCLSQSEVFNSMVCEITSSPDSLSDVEILDSENLKRTNPTKDSQTHLNISTKLPPSDTGAVKKTINTEKSNSPGGMQQSDKKRKPNLTPREKSFSPTIGMGSSDRNKEPDSRKSESTERPGDKTSNEETPPKKRRKQLVYPEILNVPLDLNEKDTEESDQSTTQLLAKMNDMFLQQFAARDKRLRPPRLPLRLTKIVASNDDRASETDSSPQKETPSKSSGTSDATSQTERDKCSPASKNKDENLPNTKKKNLSSERSHEAKSKDPAKLPPASDGTIEKENVKYCGNLQRNSNPLSVDILSENTSDSSLDCENNLDVLSSQSIQKTQKIHTVYSSDSDNEESRNDQKKLPFKSGHSKKSNDPAKQTPTIDGTNQKKIVSCSENVQKTSKRLSVDILSENTSDSSLDYEENLDALSTRTVQKTQKIPTVYSSDSEDEVIVNQKSHKYRRLPYTLSERLAIINYITRKKLYSQIKGNLMWRRMEKDNVCTNRTWQSMKEHFRKQILPRIETYTLSKEIISNFRGLRN